MIILRQPLTEGVSKIVYHNTTTNPALDILKTNRFDLTSNLGTRSDQFGDKFFYLSVSRVKYGGYARSMREDGQVCFVLDGGRFNHRYKGGPVDYWGQEFRTAARGNSRLRNDENEERVFTDDPSIPDAKKYLLEIHISTGTAKEINDETGPYEHLMNHERWQQIQQIQRLGAAMGVPVYTYVNFADYKNQNKKKAIDMGSLGRVSDVRALIDIISYPDFENFPKRKERPYDTVWDGIDDMRRYPDDTELERKIANEIHNIRTKSSGRVDLGDLSKLMRSWRVRTVGDLLRAYVAAIP